MSKQTGDYVTFKFQPLPRRHQNDSKGRLVLPLAAFGGAAREVPIALKLLDAPRVRYPEYGRNYEDALGALQALAGRHRERAGPLWDHLAAAAALSEPHRIAFQLKEILPALAPAARVLER